MSEAEFKPITMTLSGLLSTSAPGGWYGEYQRIYIVQPNGLHVCLVSRFQEFIASFGTNVNVSYFLSDTPMKPGEEVEAFWSKFYGKADPRFEASDYSYSEYTTGTDYDTYLNVGNHDLFGILKEEVGKYIAITIQTAPEK